ncbi:hypothetical protein GCM10023318_50080 [Nocardia callitridis]|uniref:SseB protein N-terminal domain-containing protein n=2 Tax=Nocardia callitridis TaxID=648753 RepID=A0ABP9KU88_9NOCA
MSVDNGLADLRSEIRAFYAGFGQPDLLMAAFRNAALYVPLTEDDRICTHVVGGVRWIGAFTGVEELAGWLAERGVRPDGEYRYHTLLGWRLADCDAGAEPVGVVVDAMSAAPMAFPPKIDDTELAVDGVR